MVSNNYRDLLFWVNNNKISLRQSIDQKHDPTNTKAHVYSSCFNEYGAWLKAVVRECCKWSFWCGQYSIAHFLHFNIIHFPVLFPRNSPVAYSFHYIFELIKFTLHLKSIVKIHNPITVMKCRDSLELYIFYSAIISFDNLS